MTDNDQHSGYPAIVPQGADAFVVRFSSRLTEKGNRATLAFRDRFWPLLVAGKMRPVVDRIFPIVAADAAHAHVKANRNRGKVILEVGSHVE